ncbi:glycoside hydrolase family 3 N-terminal domain-containing protein [Leptospira adleri]|uniref:beta-N-acetylhexosaminidase n=1 Tax=Leptospira adleri TaxID=2023186 RepID=A0A2M9YKN2_9LEPT|nr:glycoside hydrolase family 3 N-terminal domain-containing protein [Leptospira adleri]PJZ52108.1 hypothetical protein CH380_16880 [Leptospira adleri]PJZ62970.1 hypothetical protein CH376_05660 [Leptospira adleri]
MRSFSVVCFIVSAFFFTITFLIRDPLLLKIRSVALYWIFGTAFVTSSLYWFRFRMNQDRFVRVFAFLTFLFVWAGAINSSYRELLFYQRKKAVLSADPKLLRKYAEHIVVGYRNETDLENFLTIPFAGFFLTSHNISGMSAEKLKEKIENIQKIRSDLGYPAALISTDQEGGPVSRLSPPLKRPASLLELYESFRNDPDSKKKIRNSLLEKAKDLRDVGVNFNFGPVADLKEKHSNPLDFYSQIHSRAISEDPQVVSELVKIDSEVMIENGILPTLKHFPGIGTVSEDTHFFNGAVTRTREEMKKKDLVPFVETARKFEIVSVMLSHSFWKELDSQNPVSLSKLVVADYFRKEISDSAILITDDLNMFPIFYRSGGIAQAGHDSLEAGVDLLLISYDGEQVYDILYRLIKSDHNDSFEAGLKRSVLRMEKMYKLLGSK